MNDENVELNPLIEKSDDRYIISSKIEIPKIT